MYEMFRAKDISENLAFVANLKNVCMPRRHCAKPQRIATSPALGRKSSSQQASVLESAPKRALYLSRSSTLAA